MRHLTSSFLAGAIILAGSAGTAGAAVIAFIDEDIEIPTTYEGVSLNLETGEFGMAAAGLAGADLNFIWGGRGVTNDADQTVATPTWQPVRSGTGNTDPIEALGIGTEVGPSSVTSTGFGGSANHFASFASGTRQFLGYTLVLEDSTVAYGWAEVTLRDDNLPGVIHRWAYEDTGAPIAVAEIPEPSQAFLAALGLLVPILRRSRPSRLV